MKFSILKTLNYEMLNRNIDIYKSANGENPYIFMNYETIEAIESEIVPVPFSTSKEFDWYCDCSNT